jgi:hypothetical protein
MRIEASEQVVDFVVEHGGKLYVWADDAEFGHASPHPPDSSIEWAEHPADGFTLFQDTSIGEPDWWKLEFHHLPHRHVTAIWDGGLYGSADVEEASGP